MQLNSNHLGNRDDIQFLRGIAVLSVVIYHSNLGWLPNGFLGVDIFFVISGYLITKLIISDLNNHCFSFKSFYKKRARRLLPALYSTLICTSILSVFFLTYEQFNDYLQQFIGALTFSANLILPGQTGYFESAADGKPLLHIWSLSLEEQYYFILPLFLFALNKKYRFVGLVIATILSLSLCYAWMTSTHQEPPFLWRYGTTQKFEWAFFLLPMRAWELLIGSLVAWWVIHRQSVHLPSLIIKGVFTFIIFLCFFNFNNKHPDLEALLVVLSTAVILLNQNDWLPRIKLVRYIQKVGDWSYSVYLVHWPLFAFAYLGFVSNVPVLVSVALVFVSVLLGYLQYKWVEIPFRYQKLKYFFDDWKNIICSILVFLCFPILVSSHPFYNDDSIELSIDRQHNYGLHQACSNSFNDDSTLKAACTTSSSPTYAIWGDSYAMHLVVGLKQENPELVQLTKNACGPFLNVAPIYKSYGESWARDCLQHNERAFEYIIDSQSIEYVILSSPMHQYLSEESLFFANKEVIDSSVDLLAKYYVNTVNLLTEAGKKVIFVSPPPKNGRNIGECLERKMGPAILLANTCDILVTDFHENQSAINQALSKFATHSKIFFLSHDLCNDEVCMSKQEGILLYRDSGHLSIKGSIKLFGQTEINELWKTL